MRWTWLLSLSILVIGITACATPQAAPGSESTQKEASQQSMSALDTFKAKSNLVCTPGSEHWRNSGTPIRGGTFTKASVASQTNAGLDTSLPGGGHTAVQVYEHLVETRACYYEDSVMVPGLAKSWTTSADGLTWTLNLEPTAKWHDLPPVNGRAFTSADVAWMIEHQIAVGQLKSTWAPIKHEEPNANTIILKLPAPDPDFLGNVLGERNNVMMPREVQEQYKDFKTVAIGTGPYQLDKFQNNVTLNLVRTPNWRQNGVDGKPLPYIDKVEFPYFGDYAGELAAFRSGQLDLNQTLGYQKRDYEALTQQNPKLKGYLDLAPIPRGLWMNLKQKPFDDINVRKALFYATNSDEIVALGFSGGAVRTGFLPTAIAQYAWPVDKVQELFKQDIPKAKEYLAKAGYDTTKRLSFTMNNGSVPSDQGGEVQQAQAKAIGIDITINTIQGNATPPNYLQPKDQATWSGVSPASIFPDRWMGGFLRCGDSRNFTGLCDDEVDKLSLAQSRELDPAKRKVTLDQLQQRLFDLTPWVPQLSLVYYRLYSCRVKNMPSTDYQQSLTGVASAWLDPKGC